MAEAQQRITLAAHNFAKTMESVTAASTNFSNLAFAGGAYMLRVEPGQLFTGDTAQQVREHLCQMRQALDALAATCSQASADVLEFDLALQVVIPPPKDRNG